MFKNNPTRCRLGEVRLSYVHLNAPNPTNDKFGVTMLIPKSNPALKRDMDSAINAAIDLAVKSKWNNTRPPQPATPVWDGDGVRQNGEKFGPEYKGMWVVTASTNAKRKDGTDAPKPPVVHYRDPYTALPPKEIYSGMWAYCTVTFAGYNSNGKRGIGCYLDNVCKTRDDEVLGNGKARPEDDFGDLAELLGKAAEVDPLTGQPINAAPSDDLPPW